MSTHLPFLACWEFPNPFYFPSLNIPFERRLLLRVCLTIYNTAFCDFAKDFLNIFYKLLLDNLMFICNNSYVTYVLYQT